VALSIAAKMYSPNINMVISCDKIIAFRFLSSQKSDQSSRDLQMIHFFPSSGCARGMPLVAGPSGVAALLSGREGGRSGLKARKSWAPAEELLRGAGFWNR
jgi:hypothetical protein